jgi:NADH:ubiquinone oxidoreductase subunit 3 (subunit A)
MSQHYYPDPPLPVNSLAIASMVLGFSSYFVLPVVGAIAAVVTGHMAKQEIKANPYRYSGEGFATAGLIMGYAHLALTLIFLVFAVIALLMLPSVIEWITELINSIQ